jgi:hypothetical protein
VSEPKKDADEAMLARIAKRVLAMPPKTREPKPKKRKVLRRRPKQT